ncbi:MAG: hypothetical protein WC481_01395 [Candidatus Omnitrophota bacterium]
MQSQFAFLCDAVNITQNNLFNVLGGGIEKFHLSQLPQNRPVALLLRIEYNPITENGDHVIEIRIIDCDGQNKISPALLNVSFPPQVRTFNIVTNMIPRFDRYGMHSVEVAVDRHHIVSIPLNVIERI